MYFKNQSFQKNSFIKVDLLVKYSSQKKKNFIKIPLIFDAEKDFENTNLAIFEKVVYNFGRFDDDMI